jgi:hypothetical protein
MTSSCPVSNLDISPATLRNLLLFDLSPPSAPIISSTSRLMDSRRDVSFSPLRWFTATNAPCRRYSSAIA